MAVNIAMVSANRHKDPYPVYPLGTAYLKSYIQSEIKDSKVDIFDMNMISDEELTNTLKESEYDIICVSIRNVDGANSLDRRGFLPGYKQIVDAIRKATNAPLVIGGAGFSIFPEVFMKELGADFGIKGEGESALSALITDLTSGKVVRDIPNLFVREECRNRCCSYIQSPQADYEATLVDYYWKQSGMLNIQTKRGCPYNCIYCTYPEIDGRRVRTMNIDSVIETISKAKLDFGANYWFFTDSVFNINDSFNMEFAEALAKSKLNISWGAYFSPSRLTDEQMALFKRSGLTHIEFGTESFCDQTLDAYGKKFTFDEVLRCSELALKHNVFYSHFLILAGWGETRDHLLRSIENSKCLRHTVIFPYVGMRIYPNTKLCEYAIKENVISMDDNLIEPKYYINNDFDLEFTREIAKATGKAWIFPDEPQDELVNVLKLKKNKKGPL